MLCPLKNYMRNNSVEYIIIKYILQITLNLFFKDLIINIIF